MDPDLRAIAGQFKIDNAYVSGGPYGSGHINDTYVVVYRLGSGTRRFIFQASSAQLRRLLEKRPDEAKESSCEDPVPNAMIHG